MSTCLVEVRLVSLPGLMQPGLAKIGQLSIPSENCFTLPSNYWSGREASATGLAGFGLGGLAVEGLDGFSLAGLGFAAGAGLLNFSVADFDLGCLVLAVFFFPSFSGCNLLDHALRPFKKAL
ncbi:hypothetical protein Tco_0540041 [Tanacetum coccineum]